MDIQRVIDSAQGQPWLKPIDEKVQKIVKSAFYSGGDVGQRVRDLFNGTWFGHPLHPALTDVPIGAWTVAQALDALQLVTGDDDLGPSADAAMAIGLAAALPTAVSGLADWQHLVARTSRVGLLHGTLNVLSVLLYSASFVLRRCGVRGAGQVTGALGYAAVTSAAYLGGDLVFRDRIGTDHALALPLPRKFTAVMAEADLPDNQLHRVEVRGTPIVLVRCDGQIRGLAATCSHEGGPLAEGQLVDCSVICPWHGSRFSFEDGHVIHGPASFPQPVVETRVKDGQIEVRAAPK